MADVSVTWLGHASFRVDSPGGKRIYVDPWLGNPKCPDSEKQPERIDVIAITHGHSDHVGETIELAKKFGSEQSGRFVNGVLDRMAREGTRYTQAYCGTTVCAPSRASH